MWQGAEVVNILYILQDSLRDTKETGLYGFMER